MHKNLLRNLAGGRWKMNSRKRPDTWYVLMRVITFHEYDAAECVVRDDCYFQAPTPSIVREKLEMLSGEVATRVETFGHRIKEIALTAVPHVGCHSNKQDKHLLVDMNQEIRLVITR